MNSDEESLRGYRDTTESHYDSASGVSNIAAEAYKQARTFMEYELKEKNNLHGQSQPTTVEDIYKIIEEAKSNYKNVTRYRDSPMKWLDRLSASIGNYAKVLDVLSQNNPEYTGIAWSFLKLILTRAINHIICLTELNKALVTIGDVLRQTELTSALLFPADAIRDQIGRIYAIIMQFFQHAAKWLGPISTKKAILVTITGTFQLQILDTVKQIKQCTETIKDVASAASRAEVRDMNITIKLMRQEMQRREELATRSQHSIGVDLWPYLEDYHYTKLSTDKKHIRLLRLMPKAFNNPQIGCEIFEAEFTEDGILLEMEGGDNTASGNRFVENTSIMARGSALEGSKKRKREAVEDDTISYPRRYIQFEALSWRWGEEGEPSVTILVKNKGGLFKKRISHTLGLALKHLRTERERIIWIDAICINQDDLEERSFQVSLMSFIYSGAKEVCVWLGQGDEDSELAIDFIKSDICKLKNFDGLASAPENARKWRALLALMQRPWFSRRWVVQEIALAREATVYCGSDTVSWADLAIAVELFVEVETATHRLSEVMKKDESALDVYWFEHVSELSASILVSATGNIFREVKSSGHGVESPGDILPPRQSLLSLEYLVTSLSIFDCGRPHDSVYALLSISKDARPVPPLPKSKETEQALIANIFATILEVKPYHLDYSASYADVCKELIAFCIKQCHTSDPIQALDILCRPWAKDWQPSGTCGPNIESEKLNHPYRYRDLERSLFDKRLKWREDLRSTKNFWRVQDLALPSWIMTVSNAPFDLFLHPGKDLVKMGRKNADPLVGMPRYGHRNYNAGLSRGLNLEDVKIRKRPRLGHYSLYLKGFRFDKVKTVGQVSQAGAIPASWLDMVGWTKARRVRGPHDDPGDPPEEFWRTLVADRGLHGKSPPYFYMRACKEMIMKGGMRSNAVNTTSLIQHERNSIVAQFCRRVQSVIWNRALIRTAKGHLGLASEYVREGDWVCIFYGCTVPVILRKGAWKSEEDLEDERSEDALNAFSGFVRRAAKRTARKARYLQKCNENPHWRSHVVQSLADYNQHRDRIRVDAHSLSGEKTKIRGEGNERNDLVNNDSDEDRSGKEDIGVTESNEDKSREELQQEAGRKDPFRHYSLLGEAYIHGIMDGEAVRQTAYKPDHMFEIR